MCSRKRLPKEKEKQVRREKCCVREERVFLEFLWNRRCSCRCERCEACFHSFNGAHFGKAALLPFVAPR